MPAIVDEAALLTDLKALILSARRRIAMVANSTMTLLYWHLGRRLLTENLRDGRAAYGERILATVSRELTAEYGRGFSYAEIARMIQFSQLFPDEAIVVTLSRQLIWSHFHALLPIKDPLAREFYAEMCRIECWDVRTLRLKIGGLLFQRTALSRKPKAVISAEIAKLRDGHMTPDLVFRDPYLLDLLGLKGAYSERDLEASSRSPTRSTAVRVGGARWDMWTSRHDRASGGGGGQPGAGTVTQRAFRALRCVLVLREAPSRTSVSSGASLPARAPGCASLPALRAARPRRRPFGLWPVRARPR